MLQCDAVSSRHRSLSSSVPVDASLRHVQCDAVHCSVLQCVLICCNVLQYVATCCSALECVAVCCSVLQVLSSDRVRSLVVPRIMLHGVLCMCVQILALVSVCACVYAKKHANIHTHILTYNMYMRIHTEQSKL